MEEQEADRRYRTLSASFSSAAQISPATATASASADTGRDDGTEAGTVMSPDTSSAPWPNTAFSSVHQPGQHALTHAMPDTAPRTGTSTSMTLLPHSMNDSWSFPQSASMIGPLCDPPASGSLASQADPWRLETSSSHIRYPGQDVTMFSPLRSSLEGLDFDESASLNPIYTLDPELRRQHQFHSAGSQQHAAIQNHPSTTPGFLYTGREMAQDLTSYSEFANQGLVGTHYSFPFATQYVDQPADSRGVHLETDAPRNVQTRGPTNLSHHIHRMTEGSVPSSTITQAPSQLSVTTPYTELLAPSRGQTSAMFVSGGGGLDIRMHDPEFRVAPHHGPRLLQAPSSSATGLPTAPDSQHVTIDKGKGKSAPSGTDDDHARPYHGNKASASTIGRKASGVVKKVRNVLKRASADRPISIVCPFADCGETFSNLHGTIEQHVQTCRAREVQELRDSRSGWSRLKVKQMKTIRCPTCGRGRTYKTLARWTGHLKQMHGEWLKYDCTIQGCGATFVSVRDLNEHINSEHQS